MSEEKKDEITEENENDSVGEVSENAEESKNRINKKLIFAFAGMGAVIVGLVIALIVVATSGKDESSSKSDSKPAESSVVTTADSENEDEEESSEAEKEDSST